MARGDAVIKHPDREEITQRLINGESVKAIEAWLKQKYAKAPRKQISYLTLQVYRKERLNLEGAVLAEVKQERKEHIKQAREEQKKEIVENSYAYVEAKRKIAENLINVETEIVSIHDKVWQRIRVLEAEETKHLNDRVICDYLNQARTLLVDYVKLQTEQEKKASSTNININMGVVNQQVNMLKQCIREALVECGAEHVVPSFLEKLNEKMSHMRVENEANGTYNQVNIQVNNNA